MRRKNQKICSQGLDLVFIQVEAWLHANERMRKVKDHWFEALASEVFDWVQGKAARIKDQGWGEGLGSVQVGG